MMRIIIPAIPYFNSMVITGRWQVNHIVGYEAVVRSTLLTTWARVVKDRLGISVPSDLTGKYHSVGIEDWSHKVDVFIDLLSELVDQYLASFHPETLALGVILRSPAEVGTTKNLVITGFAEILRLRSE